MNIEEVRTYCLSKPHTSEDMPFGPDTLVFRVANKIFAISGLNWETCHVNLKMDPDRAIEMREKYEEVKPGYHMNKTHWNTVHFEGSLPNELLKEFIDESYDLIVASLTKKKREELGI